MWLLFAGDGTETMTAMMWYGLSANILIESKFYVELATCKNLETA